MNKFKELCPKCVCMKRQADVRRDMIKGGFGSAITTGIEKQP